MVTVIGKNHRAASPSTQPSRTDVVAGSSSKYRAAYDASRSSRPVCHMPLPIASIS